jgi:hypothetical protein
MLDCPVQYNRLETSVQADGMRRPHYNLERERSKVLANRSNGEAANSYPHLTLGLQRRPRLAAVS